EPLLVPRRCPLRGAVLPVRCGVSQLHGRWHKPRERAAVLSSDLAWARVPDPGWVRLPELELGHRRNDDRAPGGAVSSARWLLLRALGRARSALAREGAGGDRSARGARGARTAGGRGRDARDRGPRRRFGACAPVGL